MTPTAIFQHHTGHAPHPWQQHLLEDATCRDRLIRIPTGFGKTHGVLLAWLYHRVLSAHSSWPLRLVWCLPMRVLVEQTVAEVHKILGDLAWDGVGDHTGKVGVHLLMGGADAGEWHLHPEHPAVLIGTQDMLLSRALNRGYACPRARWPMEFGLLNHDALWVMDEVQLMDVGLATSAQLQAFRAEDAAKGLRPCHTWWMSATLQPKWLRSVDTTALVEAIAVPPERITAIPVPARHHEEGLWKIRKAKDIIQVAGSAPVVAASIADLVRKRHQPGTTTLVVVNRVADAVDVFKALDGSAPTRHLVHSRFRPADRADWRETFLNRQAVIPPAGRVIVATQVVEAGVDISADLLLTDLAPWTSLVQRFGRCARYGGSGQVLILDRGIGPDDDTAAAPYDPAELVAAREAVTRLEDAGIAGLERFESTLDAGAKARLYPYTPSHLLLRREFYELFDTTPDLTGADLDISRFIRSDERERDVQVFWLDIAKGATPSVRDQPIREALCSVPFLKARDWLCGEESKTNRKPRLRAGMQAWVWDFVNGDWVTAERSSLTPGKVVCVAARCGGYDPERGFDPEAGPVTPVLRSSTDMDHDKSLTADIGHDSDELSVYAWKTIACHGGEVADLVATLAAHLGLPAPLIHLLTLAGRWHDLGKAHPAFQGALLDGPPGGLRQDLAKAPDGNWRKPPGTYPAAPGDLRRGFRHELASALALFAVLERYRPDHPGLLGEVADALTAMGQPIPPPVGLAPGPVEQAILDLSDAASFNLIAYLVAAHHGKVRVALHASPADQEYRDRDGRGLPIRGVRDGDHLPGVVLDPAAPPLPDLTLRLDPAALGLSLRSGPSWRERVLGLQRQYGPAALAWLEAVLIAADRRASRLVTSDPLITGVRP